MTYRCQVCGREFPRSQALGSHMRVHDAVVAHNIDIGAIAFEVGPMEANINGEEDIIENSASNSSSGESLLDSSCSSRYSSSCSDDESSSSSGGGNEVENENARIDDEVDGGFLPLPYVDTGHHIPQQPDRKS